MAIGNFGKNFINATTWGLYNAAYGQGLGTAIQEGTAFKGRAKRAEMEVQQSQEQLAADQAAEAARIQAELEAQGRPLMEAQVKRQEEIAALAGRAAREGMPTAQRELAEQNIAQSQAQQLGTSASLGAGLRGAGTVASSTAQQYRQLNAADAAMAQANQAQYLSALGALGQAEAGAEQYNVLLPYEQKVAEMQALSGSAIQNQQAAQMFAYQAAMNRRQQNMDLAGDALKAGADIATAFIPA